MLSLAGCLRLPLIILAVSAAANPAFDVASIKSSVTSNYWYSVSSMKNAHGRLVATNITLRQLLTLSYGVSPFAITSGPKWIDSDRFDVDAKGDPSAPDKDLVLMLQTLLAERFGLRVHTETRPAALLALVVAHNAPKLKPSSSDCAGNGSTNPGCRGLQFAGDGLTAEHVTMTALARALEGILGSHVLDETGLKEAYDFKLQFVDRAETEPANAPAGRVSPVAGIFQALQQQLGLKLEARKVPMEMLVIDAVDKPSSN